MMKNVAVNTCLILSVLLCINACKQTSPAPVPIIFDTDMGPDYDDVGALTILHALADNGEAEILATVASNMYEYTVPCIDVINRYYDRPDMPTGAPLQGVNLPDGHKEKWAEALPAKFPHTIKATKDAPNAVETYRRILAQAPDTSVVVVTVGFFTNLSALLQSSADGYSPLNGKALVRKKVKRLVSMAGKFPQGREFNVHCDSAASNAVFEHWPTRILFSGFEIGEKILTGKRLIAADIPNTPAKEAFTICLRQGDFDGRQSWDQTAVLAAVRGTGEYFGTTKGRISIAARGANTWQDDPAGPHEHLTWKMPIDELTRIIEDLMMHRSSKK